MSDTGQPNIHAIDEAGRALAQRALDRRVTTLKHFTTNAGVTGILAAGEVRSRNLLDIDNYLDRIYYPNCEIRFDHAWTGHVNISVTDINAMFFNICSGGATWHLGMDGFWAVVEIDPVIVSHPDVWFATTNNRYTNVERAPGVDGFEAMFADIVYPFRPLERSPRLLRDGLADNQTTCPQAEVLYPGAVPADFVSAIVVGDEESAHSVRSQVSYFADFTPALADIVVRVDPEAFTHRVPGLASLPPADVGPLA